MSDLLLAIGLFFCSFVLFHSLSFFIVSTIESIHDTTEKYGKKASANILAFSFAGTVTAFIFLMSP